jgi:hypothetical protein
LNEKVAAPVKKTELTAGGSVALTTRHPLSGKVGTNFADMRRSVGIVRLRTKGHGVFIIIIIIIGDYNSFRLSKPARPILIVVPSPLSCRDHLVSEALAAMVMKSSRRVVRCKSTVITLQP